MGLYFITSKSNCSSGSKGTKSSKLITGHASIFSMKLAIFVSYSIGILISADATETLKVN